MADEPERVWSDLDFEAARELLACADAYTEETGQAWAEICLDIEKEDGTKERVVLFNQKGTGKLDHYRWALGKEFTPAETSGVLQPLRNPQCSGAIFKAIVDQPPMTAARIAETIRAAGKDFPDEVILDTLAQLVVCGILVRSDDPDPVYEWGKDG